jgi:6-pyruvoyltetrahydropterin/6-carboxytetrahydropterin synthase
MMYLSEKFEFAAMHKLWNDTFSEQRNFQVFGKCANPAGHGHNYIVEVTVKEAAKDNGFCTGDFEKTVDEEFISLVDHKNLNEDVSELAETNPTVENIAAFAWKRLAGKFEEAELYCVKVWESDKIYCSYYGGK